MTDQTPEPQGLTSPPPQSGGSPSNLPTGTVQGQGQSERPEWLQEAYWDAEKREPKAKELADLQKFKADHDSARAKLPKAEEYTPDLGDVKDVELDTKDPGFLEFQKLMHGLGASQEDFGRATKIFAKSMAAFKQGTSDFLTKMQKQYDETRFAEFGENAVGRIEELNKFAAAFYPKDEKKAAQALRMIKVAEAGGLEFLEGLKKAVVSQGVSTFTQTGRIAAEADDGKPAGYDKWDSVTKRTWQIQNKREQAASGRH